MLKPKFLTLGLALAGGLFAATTLTPKTAAVQLPEPTEMHKLLHRDIGVWDGDFEMSLMGQAVTGKLTETVEAFGPYWTLSRLEGAVMGLPFQGQYQAGYDPETEQFLSTWIDTMSPALVSMKGAYDKDSDMLTMKYRGPDQLGRVTDQWSTSTYDDEGRRIFESWMKAEDGTDVRNMRIVYTRRKAEKGSK